MKRIFLFLLTNAAVMLVLAVVLHFVFALFGVDLSQNVAENRDYYVQTLVFALLFGMAGSLISLLMSKQMAKASVRARTITGSEGEAEAWLVRTVEDLARRANLKTPEVAIYHGSANAFATGAFRNSALVAVSDGIMQQMTKEELRAVLGHEMSHVANGDMVTMCLLQGILNTFVIFVSRIAASLLSSRGDSRERRSGGALYYPVYYICQMTLSFLASIIAMWFSRHREFAADAGSARLLGTPGPMIAALQRLGNLRPGVLPDSLKAFGISGRKTSLFATHPSLEDRIEALRNVNVFQ